MAAGNYELGGRLPLVDTEALGSAQQRFYDAAMAEQYPWSLKAGFQFATDDHRLIGPYNALATGHSGGRGGHVASVMRFEQDAG